MRWPSWVLNEANRALQRRVHRATDDLNEKTEEAASHREVVQLMLKNIDQIQRAIDSCERALEEQKTLEKTGEEELQTVQHDGSFYRSELQTLKRRQEQLQELLLRSATMQKAKSVALEQQEEELAVILLERRQQEMERAKQASLLPHGQGDCIERSLQRLEQLHKSIQKKQSSLSSAKSVLEREREEYAQVQRQLAVLRAGIEHEKQDKVRSVLAVQQLNELVALTEAQTLANADLYSSGQQTAEGQRSVLQRLRQEVDDLRRQQQCRNKELQDRLNVQNNLNYTLKNSAAAVEDQLKEMAALRRQLAAQQDVSRHLMLSRDNAMTQRDELRAREAHLVQHAQELRSIQNEVRKDTANGETMQGRQRLIQTLNALKVNERRLANRMEQLCAANAACVSQLMQQAQQSEVLDGQVASVRRQLAAADRDHEKQRQFREHCEDVAETLDKKLKELQEAYAKAVAGNGVQYALMLGVAQGLRQRLQEQQRRSLGLRRLVTPLHYALKNNRRVLMENEEKLKQLTTEADQCVVELKQLEAEKVQVNQDRQAALVLVEKAGLQLRTLTSLVESQIGVSCEAVGMQEVMRGQALAAEAALQEEARNTLLHLHLEQRAASEKHAELRLRQQKLQALKDRYQNFMQSMARNIALAAGSKEQQGSNSATGTSPSRENAVHYGATTEFAANIDPEALYAKCILHTSTAREQLWEKGNKLDARVLFLEREVSALRKMLQAIRSADSWEEQTMGVRLAAKERIVKSHGRDESRLLDDLREGLEKGKEMVHVQLCGVKESLQALQRCAREVNEKYKTETKRLNELRTLRGSKEAALRRLRDKLRREKSVPKRQRPRPITAL